MIYYVADATDFQGQGAAAFFCPWLYLRVFKAELFPESEVLRFRNRRIPESEVLRFRNRTYGGK